MDIILKVRPFVTPVALAWRAKLSFFCLLQGEKGEASSTLQRIKGEPGSPGLPGLMGPKVKSD